ncbi:hypothetical protein ACEN2J_15085 [Pseudorhodobacter sp. W20_MBD10_FR17]|uniref:hypothetical protein n=1 Tax=Pseudorhodobacter sp. W20_MBD10_FR17 TaxID=3240266 RepID=UPI003F98B40D
MAYIATAKSEFSFATTIARPFRAVWNFLLLVAEAHPRMQSVNKLNALSDAELEARGTTRSDEVRRIFVGYV